jgi:SAM-dependent methyltransferase
MALYVNYGCGYGDKTCAPEGWLNFDASPTLRIQRMPLIGRLAPAPFPANARFGDIRKGLPVADGSVDAVYCSHVLEHLALEDFRNALKNTFRILRPGGVFRLVLPDLKLLAREYVASDKPDAAMQFMAASNMGRPWRPKGLMGLMRSWLGNSEHQWMWDYQALAMELGKAGFVSTRPAVLGDSGDVMFAKVESENRWNGALGMQTQRP